MADVVQIATWYPGNSDAEEYDEGVSMAYVRLLGPFMQTYPGLTVLDYWQLTIQEHAAMTEWLYATEVLMRPKPKSAADASAIVEQLNRFRDDLGGEDEGGVREPRPSAPVAPSGAAAVEVPA